MCECDNERGSKSNSLKVKHISCRLSFHLPALIFHFTLPCIHLVNCVNVFFKMCGNFEETEDHYTGTQASQQPKGLVQLSQMAQSVAADINRWCQHKRSPQLRVFVSILLVCLGRSNFSTEKSQKTAVTAELQTLHTHTQAVRCGNDSGIAVISDGTEGTPSSPVCSSHVHHCGCLNQSTEHDEVFAQLLNHIMCLTSTINLLMCWSTFSTF